MGCTNRPIEGAPKPAILRHRRLGYRPWLSAVAASQWWDGQSTQDGGSTSNFGTCAAAGPIGTSPANSAFTGRPLDATSGCRAAILRRPDRIQNRPARPRLDGARRRRLDGARRRRLDGARRRRLDGARRRRLDGARRRRLGERATGLSGAPIGSVSTASPWREVIVQKLEAGLTAQRIYQDISSDHGYAGSYYSVRRFIKKLSAAAPAPFRRMECEPGAEAQVDFGRGAPWSVLTANAKQPGSSALC